MTQPNLTGQSKIQKIGGKTIRKCKRFRKGKSENAKKLSGKCIAQNNEHLNNAGLKGGGGNSEYQISRRHSENATAQRQKEISCNNAQFNNVKERGGKQIKKIQKIKTHGNKGGRRNAQTANVEGAQVIHVLVKILKSQISGLFF